MPTLRAKRGRPRIHHNQVKLTIRIESSLQKLVDRALEIENALIIDSSMTVSRNTWLTSRLSTILKREHPEFFEA